MTSVEKISAISTELNDRVSKPVSDTDTVSSSRVLISLIDVIKRFDLDPNVAPAFGPVTGKIEVGEFLAVVGRSGCGKTTLLRLIAGLILPEAGVISYRSAPVTGPVDDLGMAFQQPTLLDWMTVLRNVTLQLEVRGIGSPDERNAQAMEVLGRVDLADFANRRPYQLSGGQQQRVALCRALVHNPALLLMDEPFAAVDALTREHLQADLEQLWVARRPTVVLVTHSVSEAVLLADRVIVMQGPPGHVVAEIPIDLERPRFGTRDETDREVAALMRKVRQFVG